MRDIVMVALGLGFFVRVGDTGYSPILRLSANG